jgi:methionine biosynthesis protein MetW
LSVADYYERYWTAEGYNPSVRGSPEVLSAIERRLPANGALLDVGCGDGAAYGTALAGKGVEYVGVDISAPAVARAVDAGLNVMQIEDAGRLPFEDEAFDSILCTEVLEHLFDPAGAVDEMARVLRPGGHLVVTVPNVAYWRRRADLMLLGRWNPFGDTLSVEQPWRDPHIRFFNPGALRRLLSSRGLEVVYVRGFGGGFLRDLPVLPGRLRSQTNSPFFRWAERRSPSLFGCRLLAIARRPP